MMAQQLAECSESKNTLNCQIANLDVCINQKLKQLAQLKAIPKSGSLHDPSLFVQIVMLEREVDNDIDRLVDMKRTASICTT